MKTVIAKPGAIVINNNVVQKETAVTANFTSQQLPLYAFSLQVSSYRSMHLLYKSEVTALCIYFTSQKLPLYAFTLQVRSYRSMHSLYK